MGASRSSSASPRPDDPVAAARRALLQGVGKEVAASFPGITRLGGQVVAALYLADEPRSMDQLSAELGRSKSNVFANLRALEEARIVQRSREPGARHDLFALRGAYPDVIVGAYITRVRQVTADKQVLVERALSLLGDAGGPERTRSGPASTTWAGSTRCSGRYSIACCPTWRGPSTWNASSAASRRSS